MALSPITLMATVSILFVVLTFIWRSRKKTNAPGPIFWPIIGNGISVLRNRPRILQYIHYDMIPRYGRTFCMWTGLMEPPYIMTSRPENVHHVLKTNFANYAKGETFHQRLLEVMGDGIFNVDGPMWQAQRKTASILFSDNSMKHHMSKVFLKNGAGVVKLLEAAAKSGAEIDMQNYLFRFTLDSVGEIAFGVHIGAMEDSDNEFANAFDTAQTTSERRFFSPVWKLSRAVGTAKERTLIKKVRLMDQFCLDIIHKRKAERAEQLHTRSDLLSRFMELKAANGDAACDDKVLRDVIMNFMIAGRDTTANVMTWTIYLMAKNPHVQAKLLEHLKDVPDNPSYDDIKGVPYLRNCITETLRLYPSVPKDAKIALGDDTLPDGTFVPKGYYVAWLPWSMGRTEEIWGKDCNEYKPERHENDPKPSSSKFIAFNHGPRLCLGMNMAYFEAGLLLTMLLKRFKFTVRPGFKAVPFTTVTCPVDGGLPVTVERR